MDLNNIDLKQYDLIAPTEIEIISNITIGHEERFIDITVKDDNTFFVYLPNINKYLLCRNCDGSHIKMLYIGIFLKYAPQVIKDGILKQLRTPIIVLKDKKTDKIKEYFFTINEYNKWTAKHDVSKYLIDYKKGLGSWTKEEWVQLLAEHDFEYFLDTIVWDKACKQTVEDWLGSGNADTRKDMLKHYEFSWLKV